MVEQLVVVLVVVVVVDEDEDEEEEDEKKENETDAKQALQPLGSSVLSIAYLVKRCYVRCLAPPRWPT